MDRLCLPEEKEWAEAEKMSAAGGFGRKFVENLRTTFPAKVDTSTKLKAGRVKMTFRRQFNVISADQRAAGLTVVT
jgi:hypothetical protein